jgi:hypothetical protein
MQDDPKVKCSAKKPQRVGSLGLQAYQNRWNAYRDAYCMAWCSVYPGHFGRAFYNIEIEYVKLD